MCYHIFDISMSVGSLGCPATRLRSVFSFGPRLSRQGGCDVMANKDKGKKVDKKDKKGKKDKKDKK